MTKTVEQDKLKQAAWESWEKINQELSQKGGVNPTPYIYGFQDGVNYQSQSVSEAVEVLTKALREDEGFYIAYHANIAMAFKDVWLEECGKAGVNGGYDNMPDLIHGVANIAAKRFLDLWLKRAE